MAESPAERLKREMETELRAADGERNSFLSKLKGLAATSEAAKADVGALAAAVEKPPALAIIGDKTQPAPTRLEVIQHLGLHIADFGDTVEALLLIVQDINDDPEVRLAALRILGSAAFQVVRFRPYQQAYQQALRNLVGDMDARLRNAAVGILAGQHDPEVQQALLKGLKRTETLPVERERAIQLLAEDDHLDNLPWLKELFESDSEGARQEAVRLMGSYPEAAETLETILRDKAETSKVRQQSAASLRNLARERFETVAKEIAADSTEHPDVRATSRQAVEHLGLRGLDQPA
jgi:HEAT repeat protein